MAIYKSVSKKTENISSGRHVVNSDGRSVYLFLAWDDERRVATGNAARLRRQLDIHLSVRLVHRVDLFDRVVDATREDRIAHRDHAVYLIAVASAANSVVGAGSHIPAGHDSIVRSSIECIAIPTDSHYGDGFIVSLKLNNEAYELAREWPRPVRESEWKSATLTIRLGLEGLAGSK